MAKLLTALLFTTVIGICVANGVLEEVYNATSEVEPMDVSTIETYDTTTQGDLEGNRHGTQDESKKKPYKPKYGLRDENGTCVCYAGQVISGPSVDWTGKNGGRQPPFRMFCGPKCCYCKANDRNETIDTTTAEDVEGHGEDIEGHGTQEESKKKPYKPRYGLRNENGTCVCYAGQVINRPTVDWTGKNGGRQPPFRMFCGPKCCYCKENDRNETKVEEKREEHMNEKSHMHGEGMHGEGMHGEGMHGEGMHHWGPGSRGAMHSSGKRMGPMGYGPNNRMDSGKSGKDSHFDGKRINSWGPGASRAMHLRERGMGQMEHGPTYKMHPREHGMRQMEHGPTYRMHPRERGMRQMGHGLTYRMHPRKFSKSSRGMHSLLKDMLSYGAMAPGMHFWKYDY